MNAHTIWIRELSVSEAELYYYYTITIITMLCRYAASKTWIMHNLLTFCDLLF